MYIYICHVISYTPIISYTTFCFYNIHSSVVLHYKNWVKIVRAVFISFSTVKMTELFCFFFAKIIIKFLSESY